MRPADLSHPTESLGNSTASRNIAAGGEKAAGNESDSVLLLVDSIWWSGGKNRKNLFLDVFSCMPKNYEDGLTMMCVQIFLLLMVLKLYTRICTYINIIYTHVNMQKIYACIYTYIHTYIHIYCIYIYIHA